jgi:exonuclease III
MFPARLSIVTYNLWGTARWPQREPALRQFVERFLPDVLCIQELAEQTQSFLDRALPRHSRVHDALPGWTCEGNIYWNADLLEELEHGAEDIGIIEEHRRLFWARLKLQEQDRSMFVSTAHFTWQGHDKERATGLSPRPEYTRRVIEALGHLVKEDEPAFFMGDLNDPLLAIRLLHEAGYSSCFAALGIQSPPTWQCYPTAHVSAGAPVVNQTIDWIVANPHARPISAQVPQCFHGDIAPSDHWPVLAVYELFSPEGAVRSVRE